ncbi:MAG: hypothetical protein EPO58_12210 [Chitinophagaceae bacterium]|nr:MAG: hypothetical protein EPO58_12210 [Chitinophagaceae bacterium]
MAVALRHVGIVVSDMQEALELYTSYLNCKLINLYETVKGAYISELVGIAEVEMKIAILKTEDDNRVELIQYMSHPGKKREPVSSNDIGASHFALTVKNIDSLYDQRENYRIQFLSAPLLSPDGYVKVAYAVIMNECLVELVEVLDERGRFTGGK